MKSDKQLRNALKKISADYMRSSLERDVADMILDQASDGYTIKSWLDDLMQYGCVSGMVGDLIYYSDTYEFYDDHYSDIEDLRCELEEETGETLKPDGDLKNWYAWLAFEETARKLAGEIGIEL